MNNLALFIIFVLIQLCCAGVGYNKEVLGRLHKAISLEDKKRSIYDGLQSRAFFRVIYKSKDVRQTYCEAVAEMESLSLNEKESLCKKEMEEERLYFDFFIILSTTESRVNDLASKNTMWRIFLMNTDGSRIYPLEIKEIKADPRHKLLIPGLSRFGRFYFIRFEKGGRSSVIDGMSLVLSSVIGKSVFEY